jgi:hypothetical protein
MRCALRVHDPAPSKHWRIHRKEVIARRQGRGAVGGLPALILISGEGGERLTELRHSLPVIEVDEAEMTWLLDLLGVDHLAGIEGAEERTVKLSAQSNVVCPAHGRILKPDACRSCAFLAGEITTEPRS